MLKVHIVCEIYQTCQKKVGGKKLSKFVFVIFGFVPYVYQLKIVSFQNLSPKTILKILSFESISVVISQKLNELDQFNIRVFFSPARQFRIFWRKKSGNPGYSATGVCTSCFEIKYRDKSRFKLICGPLYTRIGFEKY